MRNKSIQRLFLVPAVLCLLVTASLLTHSGKAQAASPSLIQITAQNWHQYVGQSTSSTPAPHSAVPAYIVGNPFIFSAYIQSSNGNYVADEENYTGSNQYMLRARTSGGIGNTGTWEQFRFYNNGTLWFIQSSTGNFVSDEENYTGSNQYMLRARTPASSCCGTWEAFYLYALPYTNTFFIKSSNGNYVADEENYTGSNQYMLRARTPASSCCGTWEMFKIIEYMSN